MSKKEKLGNKLFSIPAPKNFAWVDLLTLMTQKGFSHNCNGGSHYTFDHTSGFCISMSKTHPSGILKPYQVKAAKEAIERAGASIEK